MNKRFIVLTSLLFSSLLLISSCSEDNSSFETPNTSGTASNNSPVSQKNFTLLASPTEVSFFDIEKGFNEQTSKISVRIGDSKNQLVTGERTIYFRTEWGLIDPSCTTKDGACEVTWRTMRSEDVPSDLRNTIVAYSHGGQETYQDFNGNNRYDDGDTYEDLEEPYIDLDRSGDYSSGDVIIDTINGLDLTGANQKHDDADGYYNGPDCSHSTDCSPVLSNITVWAANTILLTTNKASLGGSVSGLTTGTLVLQSPGVFDLVISTDGAFTFTPDLSLGSSYNVTVKTNPAGLTCTVTDGQGVIYSDITNIAVNCS